MKKVVASAVIATLISGMVATSGFAATTGGSFSDIDSSYAKNAILQLQEKGILNGIDATHFNPKGVLTRAEFATIMVKALNLDATATTSSFSDVTGWAVPYIEAAFKAGIITGMGGDKFSPNATVTREMAVTILVRALQSKGELKVADTATPTFTDANEISDWAKKYVALAVEYGLITGNPDGSFNPKGKASREMAAVMGSNLLVAIDEVETTTPTPEPTPTPTPTPTPPTGGGGGGGGGITPPPATVRLSSIAITTEATKLSYNVGEELDITGLVVTGTYSNNTKAPIAITTSNVTGFNSSVAVDSQVLTITVNGKTTTYNVAIVAVVVPPITGEEAEKFVKPQDFGYWADQKGFNVGFQLQLEELKYSDIEKIEVALVDAEDNVLATRTARGSQITQLQTDDKKYGEEDGQLSALFIKRGDTDNNTNLYWDSSTYDLTKPAKAVISVTTVDGVKYIVENDTLGGDSIPVTPLPPVTGAEAEKFVKPQDFGYWSAQAGFNVGFQLQLEELGYADIAKIEVALVGGADEVLATRTATGKQIAQLQSDDAEYSEDGKEDGQLSALFIKRDETATNLYWDSSAYNFAKPSKAVITIVTTDGNTYIVENDTLGGDSIPPITGEEAEAIVKAQDFGYWASQTSFNVGFQLQLDPLTYEDVTKIEVSLVGENEEVLATRTATGAQIGKLQDEDVLYGDKDGQLSVSFKERSKEESNDYWTSSIYEFATPDKAVISVTLSNGNTYVVENDTLGGDSIPVPDLSVPNIENATLSVNKGLLLSFSINEDIDLGGKGNIVLTYYTKEANGDLTPISNSIDGGGLEKSKLWGGYLWDADLGINYSAGAKGEDYENVILANAKLQTLVKEGYHANGDMDYVNIDWTAPAIYVVQMSVTDNNGNVSIHTVECEVEAAPLNN